MAKKKSEDLTPPEGDVLNKAGGYEEWEVDKKITEANGKKYRSVVKLKKLRSNVKITEAEADTLNLSAISPSSAKPVMYLLPGQDLSEFDVEIKA